MEKKKQCVVFDIDGVLAICHEEFQYVHDGKEKANRPMVVFLSLLALHSDETMWETILLTGRKEESRELTEKWLKEQGIEYDSLIMRSDNSRSPNSVHKEQKLRDLRYEYDIQFLVDDNPYVSDVCKSLYIPFLHYSLNQ